jgi:hypothetical protein
MATNKLNSRKPKKPSPKGPTRPNRPTKPVSSKAAANYPLQGAGGNEAEGSDDLVGSRPDDRNPPKKG